MTTRRAFLTGAAGAALVPSDHTDHSGHGGGGVNGATFRVGGQVDHAANGFQPTATLRDYDYGTVSRLADGRVLREWEIYTVDHEVEVAPGCGSRRGRSTAGSQARRCAAPRATGCGSRTGTARTTRTPCISTVSIRLKWTVCRAWALG
jgi:hypothetical protein